MALIFALLLLVAGVLGAASLIVKNQPNARDIIAKLVPFQGIIGIILLLWSLLQLIWALRILNFLFASITGLLALLTLLVGIALGFLLGYGLIKHYALKGGTGGDAVQMKLAAFQAPLGLAAIILAIWFLITIFTSPFGMM
jgi:hypothetical protein